MTIDINAVKTVAELISACSIILGVIVAVVCWYLKLKKQGTDISEIKKENALICFALQACLDGLEQLGANHTVPVARDKLEKHLNVNAHK